MLKNYLTTALRSLRREKGNATLNLFGLTLGISASLVLFLLIRYHNGFDKYHSKFDRIYRVGSESQGNNGHDYSSGVPATLPEAFKLDYAETEEVTFTSYRQNSLIAIPQSNGEPKKYEEERGVTFAQPNFFKIFNLKILSGDATKGLDEPREAIIARSWALKYFGKEDAIGEVFRFDNNEYKITAVMEDPSTQTDLPFYLMLSYATIQKEQESHGWNSTWSDEHCYFLLKEGESIAKMEARMPAFVKKHLTDTREERSFTFQPLGEIHFDDRYGNYNYQTVSRQTLLALSIVGVFLLLTACINFINLSTAEAIKRSKEVGIRKSLGGSRKQLVIQFLGEASLMTTTSAILALGIAQVSLSWLNSFLETNISLVWSDGMVWVFVGAVTILVSLLAGLYPSFVVSGFNPVAALKNQMSNRQTSGYALRRVLVVTQFFISQFLVIGTIVLITQMDYFQNMDLGFRQDAIITLPIPIMEQPLPADSSGASRMKTLRNEIARLGSVENASLCNHPPAAGSVSGTGFTIEGNPEFYETQVKTIDSNYVALFHLELVAGKNINDGDTAQAFLVNEKLAAMVGYTNPADILGKRIQMWGKNLPVAGVLKNFHTVSLHDPIEPTILLNRIRNYRSLSIKINPLNMQGTIADIKQKWESAYSDFIFSYEFLDEQVRNFYETEQRNSVLLGLFTSLAILIGCLGLFGLASFMANQKTKEIGVRKVLGASVESILILFSKEFIFLVLIGFVLAVPLSWYVMKQWLNGFAYKIELTPVIFMEGLAVTLVVALITVAYRSVRAATVNPVKSLRSE